MNNKLNKGRIIAFKNLTFYLKYHQKHFKEKTRLKKNVVFMACDGNFQYIR